jgi:RHS repeat-associated protein
LSATFAYDPLGRRASFSKGSLTRTYFYDGLDALSDGNAKFLHGAGIDEPLQVDSPTLSSSYLQDHLGSTSQLANALNGQSQTRYEYNSYGKLEGDAVNSSLTNPYTYTGREDDGTGLYYYRARYYDSELEAFISQDPLGDAQRYVGGNPLKFIDPQGLAHLFTDMRNGTTTFDPRPEDPYGVPLTIPTRNKVDSRSKPGANDPFKTDDVDFLPNVYTPAYGPGAYINTNDPRGRDIHGGGSSLPDPYAPYQGWRPTYGCTRGQNKDVQDLGQAIADFKKRHPEVKIPYIRTNDPKLIRLYKNLEP